MEWISCTFLLLTCGVIPGLFSPASANSCETDPEETVEPYVQKLFSELSKVPVHYMTINLATEELFVGGVNTTYRLTTNLNITEQYEYPGNTIKLLVVDNKHNLLVACGTAHSGLCYRHNLTNIAENVVLLNGTEKASDAILSRTGSTVGLIALGSKFAEKAPASVFYFARTLDPDLPHSMQQSVSSKTWNKDMTGFELSTNTTIKNFAGIFSEISVSQRYFKQYDIQYLYGFSHNHSTYFVTKQPKKIGSNIFEARLIKVCQKDVGFYSYMELSIGCKSELVKGNKMRIPVDAYLSDVKEDFSYLQNGSEGEETYLFILFKSLNGADDRGDRFVCSYAMSEVEAFFLNGVNTCNKGLDQSIGLKFLNNGEIDRTCAWDDVQTSSCQNSTSRNQHLLVSKNLFSKNLLQDADGHDLKFKSYPTSLAVTVYGKSTVLVMGYADGSLGIFHIGSFRERGTQFVERTAVSERISQHLEIYRGVIFAMTENNLFRLAFADVCRSMKTCRDCLVSDYLNCGYCESFGCMSEGSCLKLKSSWSQTKCPISVNSVSPLSGPLEGGTELVICGEALGHTTPNESPSTTRKVYISDYANCTILNKENYFRILCKIVVRHSNRTYENFTSPISVLVRAEIPPSLVQDKFEIDGSVTSGLFSFQSVQVTGIYPLKGSRGGGTVLYVSGNFLDIGSNAQVHIGISPCEIQNRNKTNIICKTSQEDRVKRRADETLSNGNATRKLLASKQYFVNVTIDNAVRTAPNMFTYMPRPKLLLVPLKSIQRYSRISFKNWDR